MKPALQLRIGQHLTMTPQLQQAIRLLQLSTLDLQAEIQEVLESNPLLEIDESTSSPENKSSVNSEDRTNSENETTKDTGEEPLYEESGLNTSEALDKPNLPEESPLDNSSSNDANQDDSTPEDYSRDNWEAAATPSNSRQRDADSEAEYYGSASETLQDHLFWQMNLTPFSDIDQSIAMALIDSINDDGYITVQLDEILESLQSDDYDIEIEEIEAVLHRIQHFDPIGVGCRDLKECLLLQLRQLQKDTEHLEFTKTVIENHLELLGQRNYRQILKLTGKNEQQLKSVVELIQTLNPRPGSQISTQKEQYVVPDVYVRKIKGRWKVDLNPEIAPKIRINQTYANMSRQVSSSADSKFIKGHLQEAKWFLKSLESRNDTLLKVSQKIVDEQQGFFDFGEEAMRPLVLSDIALAVDMHESTISRVTTQKYLHSPKGILELKFFFSSHVNTSSGGSCSSTAIRALIKKLVEAENQQKPLSDSKLATVLTDQGIMVARRTVAKYRESMKIPSSNERKCLI